MRDAQTTPGRSAGGEGDRFLIHDAPAIGGIGDVPSIDRGRLRLLIEKLVATQLESARLARRVMMLQELADAAEHLATRTIDLAAGDPADPDAVEAAVASAAAASLANADEIEASAVWAAHLQYAGELLRQADEVAHALGDERAPA